MSRTSNDTVDRIFASAYGLLYREGFARVSMDAIAQAAGVTKRTLCYHFDSKDALVAAVLERQHLLALDRIRGWAKSSEAKPSDYLASLFEALGTWAAGPNWLGSGFTRLTMELADMPGHPARRAAHRHKLAVENWLEQELAGRGAKDSRQLACHAMLLVEGCLAMILLHGDRSYAEAAAVAARKLAEE